MFQDSADVAGTHIGRHRFDSHLRRPPELAPKGGESAAPLALANVNHRTAVQIQDDSNKALLAHIDFIDSNSPELLE